MVLSKQELAQAYGVSTRTLRRWLSDHGLASSKKLLTPQDLKPIFKAFGRPPGLKEF